MSAKQILFHNAARAKIVEGVNILADAVKMTLGSTKVTRSALQNAASIASFILTADAMIADLPEKKQMIPGEMGGMEM